MKDETGFNINMFIEYSAVNYTTDLRCDYFKCLCCQISLIRFLLILKGIRNEYYLCFKLHAPLTQYPREARALSVSRPRPSFLFGYPRYRARMNASLPRK